MATGIDKCIDDVAGEMKLPRERVAAIAEQLQATRARLEGENRGARVEGDLRSFAKDKAERLRVEAMRTRKGAAEDAQRLARNLAWGAGHQAKGIADADIPVARLVGDVRMPDSVQRDRMGIRDGIKATLSDKAHREAPIVFEMLKKKDAEAKPFFDDVAREWAEIGKKGGKPGVTKNADALKVAEVLKAGHEAAQIEKRRVGVNPGETDGATMPVPFHERRLIAAGETRFVKDAADALDLAKMFPGTPLFGPEAREIVHTLQAEFHDAVHGRGAYEALVERGGLSELSANLKKRLESRPVWHFKDADAWIKFNDKYGRGHVVAGVMREIEGAARDVALIGKFGSNSEAGFRLWLAHMQKGIDQAAERGEIGLDEARRRINSLKFDGHIKDAWDVASGRSDIASDAEWNLLGLHVKPADFMRNVRQYVALVKLGSSMLSQFPDLATVAATLRFHGKGLWESHLDALKGALTGGDPEVARLLGVTGDAFTNDLHMRFAVDDLKPGMLSRAIEGMYKWGGTRFWTDRLERAFATMHAAWLGRQAEKGWAEIDPAERHVLGLHGFTEKDWETARAEGVREINGETYLLPGGIKDPSLRLKLRGYFADEAHYAVVKGDDRTKLFAYQGTRAGTVKGEVARTMLQFSTFTAAFGQRTLARELRGYAGADAGKGLLRSIPSAVARNPIALANIVVAATAYGALSMVAKDYAKNRTARDFSAHPVAFTLAAMAQGGGLGIYGDFLFGQADRNGGGLPQKFAGPAVGTAGDLLEMLMKARNRVFHPTDKPGPDDIKASDFIRFFRNNNPVWPVNLWYTKALFDMAVLNGLEEWASPGTFARREASLKQQFGQRYLVSPLIAQGRHSPRGAWQ